MFERGGGCKNGWHGIGEHFLPHCSAKPKLDACSDSANDYYAYMDPRHIDEFALAASKAKLEALAARYQTRARIVGIAGQILSMLLLAAAMSGIDLVIFGGRGSRIWLSIILPGFFGIWGVIIGYYFANKQNDVRYTKLDDAKDRYLFAEELIALRSASEQSIVINELRALRNARQHEKSA